MLGSYSQSSSALKFENNNDIATGEAFLLFSVMCMYLVVFISHQSV